MSANNSAPGTFDVPPGCSGEDLTLLAHDLRNVLASITTSLHILRLPAPGRAAAEQARHTIGRQADQLIRLAEHLLNVARSPAEGSGLANSEADKGAPPVTAAVCRVLVVDDNRAGADSLVTLLRLWGHQAQATYEGIGALSLAQEWQPDVCLLDIWMPGMNGYQLAERLRQELGGPPVLLVAMTGFAQEWDRRLATEAGFDARLVKPVEAAALRELLARGGTSGKQFPDSGERQNGVHP
jgi:CheY-like chemotaxis protein